MNGESGVVGESGSFCRTTWSSVARAIGLVIKIELCPDVTSSAHTSLMRLVL